MSIPPRPREGRDTSKRVRRRRRFVVLSLCLVVLPALVFLFRNPILGAVVRAQLSGLTGGEVEVEGARFEGLSGVRIDRVSLRAPGWPGPGGDVLLVEDLEARLRPVALLRGRFGFDRILIDHVRLRIAESARDATSLNVAALGPPERPRNERDSGGGGDGLGRIGQVVIERLEIESGIADGERWQSEGRQRYRAEISPLDAKGRSHEFWLDSIEGDRDGVIAKGILDARSGGFSLRTDDVELDRASTLILSATARAVADAMDLAGTLREATVEWRPGESPVARLQVDDLAFTPPSLEDLNEQWVRFADGEILEDAVPPLPRVELARGRIELDGDLLLVRGEGGRLVRDVDPDYLPATTVTAEFRTRLDGVDPPADESLERWGRLLLDTMPFTLEIGIDRFVRLPGEANRPVDIPRPVAEALELLTAEAWDLTASASISRGDLDTGPVPDAPLVSRARLDLLDGRGMYHEFRYPLHDVQAVLEVEGDRIHIRRLTGLGPSDDTLSLTGMIDGLGADAGVDLRLASDDIGLDDDLLSALPPPTERGLRTLFDRTAAERLEAAGLLPDRATLDLDAARLAEIRTRLDDEEMPPDRRDRRRLETELERLRTRVARGVFHIGGRGELDLRIHRPRREGHPVAVEGRIGLRDVGGIFNRFPYPLFVERGTIVLEDLAVTLESPGLEISTIEGGRGTVSGRVDLPRDGRGGRDVHPDLRLRVRGDAIGPLLYAAIPPDVDGRPSPDSIPGWPGIRRASAIEPIVEMGLAGTIDYEVAITTDQAGEARFRVDGVLRDGTARPNAEASREVAEAGLVWPRDFTLEDVSGVLVVDDDGLELTSFTGRRGAGTVQARGTYDFRDEAGRGIARLRDLEIEDYLLDLVPAEGLEDARRLWRRWRPEGRFHADLHWRRADGDSSLELEAEPLWATFDTALGRTRVDAERGRLRFEDRYVGIEDLALAFGDSTSPDGALRLAGEYGYGDTLRTHVIEGTIDEARFESPAIDEVLALAVGESFVDWWRGRAPEGGFDGRFQLRTGRESGVSVDLEPRAFSLLSRVGDAESRGGGRIEGEGRVSIRDRKVVIGPLALLGDDGAEIDLDLRIADVDRPEILARFAIELPDLAVTEAGFVPPPFSSVLDADSIAAAGVKVVGELTARFGDGAAGSASELPDFYRAEGSLDFDRLEWVLGGTPIVTGSPTRPLAMELEAVDGRPTWFDLDASFPRILVADRPVADVHLDGAMSTARDHLPGSIRVRVDRGRLGDGQVRLDSHIDPETDHYRAVIDLTDIPLDALGGVEPVAPSNLDGGGEDRLPGRLAARISLEGDAEDPSSRIGGGLVEVTEARLADGGALALLQLGQLMPPIADEMAHASARLWIDGSSVRLSDVRLEADTVRLLGDGDLRLDDWAWSIRLLPRGSLPLIAELVSAISGTLGAIDISGTPDAPVVTFTPLPLVFGPAGPPSRIGPDDVGTAPTSQASQPSDPETAP